MSHTYNYIGKEITTDKGATYKLEEGLGHGGMGEVYLAVNVQDPSDKTAIKIIKPDFVVERKGNTLDETIKRFHKEARMGESLHRANNERFTEILSIGTTGIMPYFQMEYFEGHQLDQLFNKEKEESESAETEVQNTNTKKFKSTISTIFRRAISQVGIVFENAAIAMKLLQQRHPDIQITLGNMKQYITPDIEQKTIAAMTPLEITESMIIKTDQNQAKPQTIKPKKWVTLEDSIEIHYQVLEALDALQKTIHVSSTGRKGRAIAHRDVKPSNVLVSIDRNGETTQDRIKVKLIDNGVIYVEGEKEDKPKTQTDTLDSSTFQGEILGTPHYMPPECAKSESVATSTDVYSVGVMLYRHLTGKFPRGQGKATPIAIIMEAANNAPVTWITKERTDLSQKIAFLIHKMLISDKTKRPDVATTKKALDYFRNNPDQIFAQVTPQTEIDKIADHIIELEEQLGITEDNLQDKVLEIYTDEDAEKIILLTGIIDSYNELIMLSGDDENKGTSNLGYWRKLKTYIEARTLLENPDMSELSEIETAMELEEHRLKELGLKENTTYFAQRKQQRKAKQESPKYQTLLTAETYTRIDILCGNVDSLQITGEEDSITDGEGLGEYKATLTKLRTERENLGQNPTKEQLQAYLASLKTAKTQFGLQLGTYGSADHILMQTLKQTRTTLDTAIKSTEETINS